MDLDPWPLGAYAQRLAVDARALEKALIKA
jgi:hypothetical protein